jgi:uncharacterized membrane protein YhhN
MRPFWTRFTRHAIAVGVILAVFGYLLAQAFLISHRIYAGGAYNTTNERVLWQTPVVMAAMGIVLMAAMDLLAEVCRKPAPVPATPPTNNSTS